MLSEVSKKLQTIPNIGPKIAAKLMKLGIRNIEDLAGKDAQKLYQKLNRLDGVRHDPCLLDAFTSAVAYAQGQPARPWWYYSRLRKSQQRQ